MLQYGDMFDSRVWAGKIQDKLGASCSVRKKGSARGENGASETKERCDVGLLVIGITDAEAEAPILWPPDVKSWLIRKRPWCWEKLKAGGEGDDRGRDGWMASPTRWTWIWASSGSWWWTGKRGVLQSMGSQRIGYDWVTERDYNKRIKSTWVHNDVNKWLNT